MFGGGDNHNQHDGNERYAAGRGGNDANGEEGLLDNPDNEGRPSVRRQ